MLDIQILRHSGSLLNGSRGFRRCSTGINIIGSRWCWREGQAYSLRVGSRRVKDIQENVEGLLLLSEAECLEDSIFFFCLDAKKETKKINPEASGSRKMAKNWRVRLHKKELAPNIVL